MSVLQLKNISIIIGNPPLLDAVDFVLQPGERVCLVGRNGSGKSTLLKVVAGEIIPDDGQRIVNSHARVSRLPQDPPTSLDVSLFEYVAQGMEETGNLLSDYFRQTAIVVEDHSEQALAKLERLQQALEHADAWRFEQQIHQVLTKLGLEPDMRLSSLSGGWRRKAALARALCGDPEVLLLDEPTNHLDIDMIQWLETSLKDYAGAIVFVSHDRAFIRAMATRIVDLDRGHLKSYPGNYETYLTQKQIDLDVEATHNQEFDKKLAQEEVWIRQGIKARRTRNEGRVRALKALRNEHQARRNTIGNAKIQVQEGNRSGKRIFETEGLSYSIDGKTIVENLDFYMQRGDKVALVGPNGCGKSTLIKLLLEKLTPLSGKTQQGVNLEIAYFDQHRNQLDLEKTVMDVVADGKKELTIDGRPRHVISYLQDYLFTPERLRVPVKALSGGEKNRLLLAKLLAKPSNLLILDEPTNDLDVETLELLEETITNYPGSVLLVSHDREFVDNVVTSSLFFEGKGKIKEFVGGYTDIHQWYQEQQLAQQRVAEKSVEKAEQPAVAPSPKKNKKLSYKHQLELDALPAKIEEWEAQIDALQQEINSPEFFKQEADASNQKLNELAAIEAELEKGYARWDELESQMNS